MQFRESGGQWQQVPQWAAFLITFGYHFYRTDCDSRRISLISMPCDSAAAGLVTLGAVRRSIENPTDNDVSRHFQRLQYGGDRILRHRREGKKRFKLSKLDGLWGQQVTSTNKFISYRRSISQLNALDWYFEGEPFIEAASGQRLPYESVYKGLIENANKIIESNLRTTYSGICLAGRVTGKTRTRKVMACPTFRCDCNCDDTRLDLLLSIHGWSPEMISRASFFNTRTKTRDRETAPPVLTVADGDASFMQVVDSEGFGGSEIIGVLDRTLDRSRLDAVREKMASLDSWYTLDMDSLEIVPATPKGISCAIWRRR